MLSRVLKVSRGSMALAALLMVSWAPAAQAAPAAEEASWDKPDKKWRLGPVKYLLTKDEDKEYKGLETDEARERFVLSFWERRDPTPGTPGNEYRDAFYTNAREATARFTEDGGKGWQDDRGKIFILLGPPDDMSEQEGLLSTGGSQLPTVGGGYGSPSDSPLETQGQPRTVRFVYLRNPFGEPGRLELTFKSDVTGGFRLQDKVDWDAPIMRGLATSGPEPGAPAAAAPAVAAAPQIPESPVAPPAPPPPAATPQSELMEQVRTGAAGNAAIPLQLNMNYYKARDDSTSSTLTLEIPADAIPAGTDPNSLIVAAEFLDDAGESVQRFFNEDQFGFYEAAAKDGRKLVFQSQRSFAPGRYKAILALKDPASGALGKLEKDVEVPSFASDALGFSTITLAHKLEPLPAAPAADTPQPFILGSFRVVPRSSTRFLHGEEMIFYYQVYGADDDPTGKPKLDITYMFELKRSERWVPLSKDPVKFAGQAAPVQAYGLPINPKFPSGDYRVRIEVTDAVSGDVKTAEIPFTVDAPEKTTQAK